MPYDEWVKLPDGGTAIVRYSGKRPKPACACGGRGTLQCDYPTSRVTTCSKFMCRDCAGPRRADGTDYCPEHRYPTGATP